MKIRLFFVLATLFNLGASSCTGVRSMNEISQVSYAERSGTLSPEFQLDEQIVITRNKVTLTRKGKTEDTWVNEGVWELTPDEQEVGKLFEYLESIDCSSIKRVEPDELEVGGGAKSYSVLYAGDKIFDLRYGGGVTYTDGMLIAKPIEAFIRGLAFPAGATNQYKSSPD